VIDPPWRELVLTVRTLRYLRPGQVGHRVRLRAQRALLARVPEAVTARRAGIRTRPAGGWPASFVPLGEGDDELRPAEIAAGTFTFLGETRSLGVPHDWLQAGASHLWRYHLHYFDWAWAFAGHPDREWARGAFTALWRSWDADTRFGRGDAWSPYVASLRAWTICAVFPALVEGSPIEQEVIGDLARHATFLRTHLELDVGGNHLLKNLKALVGLSVFLDRPRTLAPVVAHLRRQLQVQVLEDGGHFELSPSYHCQVLGDLVDIGSLLAAAGRAPVPGLDEAVESMRRWLGQVVMPDGDVPSFNDCVAVGAGRVTRLRPGPPAPLGLTLLGASGYAILRPDERLHLVADVGQPCPAELPAHAHADCLSYELCVDGQRLIVNTGTSTYAPGPRRRYERSTEAHTTVEVDGSDQTEVWAIFRAARRAHATVRRADANGTVELAASHDGYCRLSGGVVHSRTWRAGPGTIAVTDDIEGRGVHSVTSRLYLAPGVPVARSEDGTLAVGSLDIEVAGSAGAATVVEATEVARRFGRLEPAHRVVTAVESALPVTVETVIRVRPSSAPSRPAP
jgi:uncharacterized heparinase superfamily protein